MFCSNCGKKLDENSRFCPNCGEALNGDSKQPASSIGIISTKTLLIIAAAVIIALTVIVVVLLLHRGGAAEVPPERMEENVTERTEEPELVPTPEPAELLVGTWTNSDGVGLKFTEDGILKLSGLGLTLGDDTFTYTVNGENSLTLTASVGGILSADMEAPYGIVGDTLYIQIGDYSFELKKK